jgi:hypothetical protein
MLRGSLSSRYLVSIARKDMRQRYYHANEDTTLHEGAMRVRHGSHDLAEGEYCTGLSEKLCQRFSKVPQADGFTLDRTSLPTNDLVYRLYLKTR